MTFHAWALRASHRFHASFTGSDTDRFFNLTLGRTSPLEVAAYDLRCGTRLWRVSVGSRPTLQYDDLATAPIGRSLAVLVKGRLSRLDADNEYILLCPPDGDRRHLHRDIRTAPNVSFETFPGARRSGLPDRALTLRETEIFERWLIRERVSLWRRGGHQGITLVTRKLLEYWTDPERSRRLFFAQVEAAETAIYIGEVVNRSGRRRGPVPIGLFVRNPIVVTFGPGCEISLPNANIVGCVTKPAGR